MDHYAPEELKEIITRNDNEALERYLQQHLELKQRQRDDALYEAVNGRPALVIVGTLLRHGSRMKSMVFIKAIHRGDPGLFDLFLKHGWDVDSLQFGNSAVQYAVHCEASLLWLLKHGANPNLRGRRQGGCGTVFTPLTAAAHAREAFGLEILLSHGAEMDSLALLEAIPIPRDRGSKGEDWKIPHMKILLENGADVNHQTRKWGTPLHYAVRNKGIAEVKLLFAHGADRNIRDILGRTPAESARENGYMELVELLEKNNEVCP